jgi:hypothetical protein
MLFGIGYSSVSWPQRGACSSGITQTSTNAGPEPRADFKNAIEAKESSPGALGGFASTSRRSKAAAAPYIKMRRQAGRRPYLEGGASGSTSPSSAHGSGPPRVAPPSPLQTSTIYFLPVPHIQIFPKPDPNRDKSGPHPAKPGQNKAKELTLISLSESSVIKGLR